MRDCVLTCSRGTGSDGGFTPVGMRNPAGEMALTGTHATIKERFNHHVELGSDMCMREFVGRDTIEPPQMVAGPSIPESR